MQWGTLWEDEGRRGCLHAREWPEDQACPHLALGFWPPEL